MPIKAPKGALSLAGGKPASVQCLTKRTSKSSTNSAP